MKSPLLKQVAHPVAIDFGVDRALREGIVRTFVASFEEQYDLDKRQFVSNALMNDAASYTEIAVRLGVSKGAVSNWAKGGQIRAKKLDLLIAMCESHTAWPQPRDRYNRAMLAACTYCRSADIDDPQSHATMELECLVCLRLVLASPVWSKSVIFRRRDDEINEEAARICDELQELGVAQNIGTLGDIDHAVSEWMMPYVRCVYVLRGEHHVATYAGSESP